MQHEAITNATEAIRTLWQQNKIWESLSVQVGSNVFELNERHGTPHLLFHHENGPLLTDFLIAFASAAARQYSPDDVRFFIIDPAEGRLSQHAQSFPHFAGSVRSDQEWNGGLYLLTQEGERRSKALNDNNKRDGYQYAQAYHEGAVQKPMPALFVIVNGCNHYSDATDDQYYELVSIIRLCRTFNVHLIMATNAASWSDQLASNTQPIPLSELADSPEEWLSKAEHTALVYHTFSAQLQLKQNLLLDEHRWHWDIPTEQGETKTLELIHGNLCDMQPESDVVVCSAFKNDYLPTPRSLIGALAEKKGIDVMALAEEPELDFRPTGCWLSRDTGADYRRIACVELISWRDKARHEDQATNTIIQKSFSTLRFLLEQAAFSGIPVKTVALPLLGTGEQGIDLTFISSPLLSQCRSILQTNPGVERLLIYERDGEKARAMAELMTKLLSRPLEAPRVFISYSSKQEAIAQAIHDAIEQQHIACWMAPNSIPAGSSYQSMIPIALQQVDVVLLILTPDAEKSRWVQKEIGSAIGAGKKLLPYQLERGDLSQEFRFLLDGEQILYCETPLAVIIPDKADPFPQLIPEIKRLLAECSKSR